jgi:methionyl-tRNA formyltransferase
VQIVNENYIVATIRPWNVKTYEEIIRYYPGNWHLITKASDLTKELINQFNPRYIFFPHWSCKVPSEILTITECVGFHETDLPYGRGGSPLQNLIANAHTETMISAMRMVEEMDAGPVYLKRKLSLEGLAEEIYIRASNIVAEMILEIITKQPVPEEQDGTPSFFVRRKPQESEIPIHITKLKDLFNFLRMLDAVEYPKPFIRYGNFKFEISRPALRTEAIEADIKITKCADNHND